MVKHSIESVEFGIPNSDLGSNLGSMTYKLCDLGQVTSSRRASATLSAKYRY